MKRFGLRPQRGFTLIEMGLVLILITLVLSGTLRGAELISSAQIKELAEDFQSIRISLNAYQDNFRFQPGDDARADAHLGAAAQAGNGNGIIDGTWYDSGNGSEASRAWQHIRLAGLMRGSSDFAAADYQPLNALGHAMGLQGGAGDPALSPILNAQGTAFAASQIICSRGIPGRFVLALDTMLDDGKPDTGAMLATLDIGPDYALGAAAATLANGTVSDLQRDQRYIVCMGI